jgi:sporadic carbohydrate cluster protein (TIGR04323 family)
MNLKGYISVRLPVPVSVQNLVVRDYCQRNGHTYFLSDVEYVMPDCFVMLRGMKNYGFDGVVAYSMFQAPREEWLKVGKEIHFALENKILPRDLEEMEVIWKLK